MSRLAERPVREEASVDVAEIGPLTRDFLAWVASRPRTYAETMEAWRTSCPRFPVWEDALGDGLVRLDGAGAGLSGTRVVLTPRGQALLDGAGSDGRGVPRP
jgi:hypothetical protein